MPISEFDRLLLYARALTWDQQDLKQIIETDYFRHLGNALTKAAMDSAQLLKGNEKDVWQDMASAIEAMNLRLRARGRPELPIIPFEDFEKMVSSGARPRPALAEPIDEIPPASG